LKSVRKHVSNQKRALEEFVLMLNNSWGFPPLLIRASPKNLMCLQRTKNLPQFFNTFSSRTADAAIGSGGFGLLRLFP